MDAIPAVISAMREMIREARRQGVVVFLGTLLPERPGGKRALHPEVIVPINESVLAASEDSVDWTASAVRPIGSILTDCIRMPKAPEDGRDVLKDSTAF